MTIDFEKLRKANDERSVEWCGDKPTIDDLSFCTIELAGESGEASDAVKKLLRHLAGMKGGVNLEQSLIDIGEELADTVISADRVASCLGIELDETIRNKFNKTTEKHGFKTRL